MPPSGRVRQFLFGVQAGDHRNLLLASCSHHFEHLAGGLEAHPGPLAKLPLRSRSIGRTSVSLGDATEQAARTCLATLNRGSKARLEPTGLEKYCFFWISREMISSKAEHSSRELSAYSQRLLFAPSLRSSAISSRAIFNSAFIKSHQTSKNAPSSLGSFGTFRL